MGDAAVQPVEIERELLVRKSAALGHEMGFWAVCAFSFSSIGLAYCGLIPFSTFAGSFPGVDMVRAIAIGGFVALLLAYTYAVMGVVAPRYAADYVAGSRVISPALAFASSSTLVLFMAMAGGWIVAWIGTNIIPLFAQTLARVVYDKSLLGAMEWSSSPGGVISLGTAAVVVIYLCLILPPRWTQRVLLAGSVLSIAAWLAIVVLLWRAPASTFQTAWDTFMGGGSFLDHLVQARRLGGAALAANPGMVALGGLLLGLGLFSGFYNPTFFAGEVKESKKNLLLGSWAALGACLVLLVAVTYLMQRLAAPEWLTAESFLSRSGTYQGLSMPWLPFYVAILHPSRLLVYFLGIAWVFGLLNLAHTFLYTASRIMLGWGADCLLPDSVVFIHPELRSPIIPVLLVSIAAEAGVVETALNAGISSGVNPLFFVTGTQLIPVLGITLLPFLRRDWYQKTSGIARLHLGPLPLITLAGGLTFLYLLAVIAELLLLPGDNRLDISTVITFAIVFLSGLAWFYVRRKRVADFGNDLIVVARSTPEETPEE